MFVSNRLPPDRSPNRLSQALEQLRQTNEPFVDLTESNPTRAGFTYPPDLLAALSDPAALHHDPQPFGLAAAREAVAREYGRRGALVDPSQIVLTASTSESYSWLFKLLCNPGDRVLVPRPSYPLFEQLTRLEAVQTDPYDLEYHRRWEIDMASLDRAVTPRTRALLVVSPNNPTGSTVTGAEHARLTHFCAAHRLTLIADEVFVDYPLEEPGDRVTDLAVQDETLAFTLGGLSKSLGLPQMKLGWMLVGGPPAACAAAAGALELIADSYLSVSTPVQVAAADLLARGGGVRQQIQARVRENLDTLRREAARHASCEVLRVEGGWSAVVRVPATGSEEDLVLDLLQRERILVHPGYFFDFPREAYLVVSLLPPPAVVAEALPRLLALACAGRIR